MKAYLADLSETASPQNLAGLAFSGFDIAAVSTALHHMDDPLLVARRLVDRLRPGGVLLVLDFTSHEHHGVEGNQQVDLSPSVSPCTHS